MATSAILIEELTGKKRRLELRGGGLPFRPASYSSETKLATQFYPGNKRGSQQVLAPTLAPSDWSGMWRTWTLLRDPCQWTDTEGGTPVAIAYAYTLWDIFDSLKDEAQLLRVTWTNRSTPPSGLAKTVVVQREHKVVRLGRIGPFEAKPDNLDDIGWTMSFVWIGKGDSPPKLQHVSQDLVAAIQQAINSQNGVEAVPNSAPHAPPTHFTLGTLEQFTQAPLAMVNSFARAATSLNSRMRDLGNIILKVRDIPASLYGRALDVANDSVGTANNFLDQISRESSESMANRQKVTSLTRAMSYYSGAMTQAQFMAESSSTLARASAKRRNAQHFDTAAGNRVETSDLIDVVMPKKTDTWLSLSTKYYQADLSSELAKANGQSSYSIKPQPTMVIIPTRAVLDSLSQRSA